jgi:formylglycine-generating enzyme required for sulfatase activity/serine/threonine protein kinase
MPLDDVESLSDAATFAGQTQRRPEAEMSLGDARTLGGDSAAGIDPAIGEIEVVDLEARYKPEGTLGQGGMGAVMLATDTRLDRKVAIKRILGEAAANRMALQRFLTEAKSIAALNHPNVVQIYDYGWAKDGPFLIMEYVDGGSLLDRCKAGPLPLADAIELACQICDGLAKAHDAGIVHRDIKPANVLLTRDGYPKLTDFGLAKAESGDHGQTITGAVLGTPDFMPPEQRRDAAEVDHRSDLWSLAATVYQMLTGRSPKIIRFNDIPALLQEVLGKALEDRKDARYQSARELREALRFAGPAIEQPAAAARIDGALQEGQCRACGEITSDLTKKFCRNSNCGASLRVLCLKCDAQIPVWDGVCGECGGNQPQLLESRRASLVATQAQAESLANACDFDAALVCAAELSGQTHPDLAEFVAWAGPFVAATTAEKTRQVAVAADRLQEAKANAAAWDYASAIHVLESIPPPVRDQEAGSLLEACGQRKRESESLIATIADRIKRKEIDGLLPIVEKALALRGDRKDLAKMRGQLVERRDGRLKRAMVALAGGDAKTAASAFARAAKDDFSADHQLLIDRVRRAAELEDRIATLAKDARAAAKFPPEKAASILRAGKEYLTLNPKNEQVASLVAQCQKITELFERERNEREELAAQERARSEIREAEQRAINGAASPEEILSRPPLVNSFGIELKLLPAGEFTMGQADPDGAETPHQVRLTKPFYMGVVPVTNAQWKMVMGSEPSEWKDADRPVETVSWKDAVEFCRRLSADPDEKNAGRVYRLPTEAEWEYACRAGRTTDFSFGDDESRLQKYAWFANNSGAQKLDAYRIWQQDEDLYEEQIIANECQTHPVGEKKPNPWGLYDMHGNVCEWCSDRYGDYGNRAATDPQGPIWGSNRVFRGGSWFSTAMVCRSAHREWKDPSFRSYALGFRLALTPSGS